MNPIVQNILYWKVFYARVLLNVVITIGMSIQTALVSVNWADLTGQEKFLIIVGATVLVSKNFESLIDKTWAKLSAELPALNPVPANPPPIAPKTNIDAPPPSA